MQYACAIISLDFMGRQKKGFTIIEVVLVLAIGGLIFLMVFIALPALQQSQRNSQRRRDVDRLMSAMMDYQSNNSGKLPFKENATGYFEFDTNFITRYMDSTCEYGGVINGEGNIYPADGRYSNHKFKSCGDAFTDPDGTIYALTLTKNKANNAQIYNRDAYDSMTKGGTSHTFGILTHASCGSSENIKILEPGCNNFIIVLWLEGGSVYCVDNK